MDFVEELATRARRHPYEFREVDVILLEGIFLLKQELRAHYDLSIWIDCSFKTALARAIARAREAATMIIRNNCINGPAGSSRTVEVESC
jgi:uridine kinase